VACLNASSICVLPNLCRRTGLAATAAVQQDLRALKGSVPGSGNATAAASSSKSEKSMPTLQRTGSNSRLNTPSGFGSNAKGLSDAECRQRVLSNTESSLHCFQRDAGSSEANEFIATTMFILANEHLLKYLETSRPHGSFDGFDQQLWQRPEFTPQGRVCPWSTF